MLRNTAWRVVFCLVCAACARSDDEWRGDLKNPDPHVRGLAAIGLSLQAPRAAEAALPVLLKTIDRSDVGLEREAARALSLLAPEHVEWLLEELVGNSLISSDRRGAMLNALVASGAKAAGPIVVCLQGPGRDVADQLGEVLLQIGAPAVPSLVQLLASPDDFSLQNYAAFLLGKLGPRARGARPALEEALNSPDKGVRRAARGALQAMGRGRGASKGP